MIGDGPERSKAERLLELSENIYYIAELDEMLDLNKDILIGLAIINPIYFICMMIGAMKTFQISSSVILGSILGPAFYFLSPEWCILFGGFIAGTIAFFIGEKNGN